MKLSISDTDILGRGIILPIPVKIMKMIGMAMLFLRI